jgi:hypothetical protein
VEVALRVVLPGYEGEFETVIVGDHRELARRRVDDLLLISAEN